MRAAILALALVPTSVAAQERPCAPVEALRGYLHDQGMSLEAAPLVNLGGGQSGQAEIYVHPSGEWIMVAIHPGGMACAAMAGTSWHVDEGL